MREVIVIGLILGYVTAQLARRDGDFLIGPGAPTAIHKRLRQVISAHRGVRAVPDLVITFLGPRHLSVIARIEIDDELNGEGVGALLRAMDRALSDASPLISRIDLVPYDPN